MVTRRIGGRSMKRKMIMADKCSLNSDGVIAYLDEHETREEAERALHEAVLENIDYTIIEIEE